ncbi:MFS transporter [Candidatus Bathyarchaeota archaeon]|nr:MFS transporter [Candidatus Bathyarchaeota archaeon]
MHKDSPGTLSVLREIFKTRNVSVLTTTQTLSMIIGTLWTPFQALYILELGASKQDLGLIFTIQSFTELLIQIPGGILADRWGRKKVIILSVFLRLLSTLIFFFAFHWIHIAPALILTSASIISAPASSALLAESIRKENVSTAFAAIRTITEFPLIFTSLIGGVVIDKIGLIQGVKTMLIAYVLVNLVSILLQWIYITETVVKTPLEEEKINRKGLLQDIKELSGNIWVLAIIMGISTFALRLISSYTVVYATEVIGLSTTQWGLLGAIANLTAILVSIPGGRISDSIGRKTGVILSRIPMTLATLGYTISKNFTHLAIVRTLNGLGSGIGADLYGTQGGPLWQALIVEYTPSSERGKIMGIIGTIKSVLSAPASWIGGYLYEKISPSTPFWASFLIDSLAILVLVTLLKPSQYDTEE